MNIIRSSANHKLIALTVHTLDGTLVLNFQKTRSLFFSNYKLKPPWLFFCYGDKGSPSLNPSCLQNSLLVPNNSHRKLWWCGKFPHPTNKLWRKPTAQRDCRIKGHSTESIAFLTLPLWYTYHSPYLYGYSWQPPEPPKHFLLCFF